MSSILTSRLRYSIREQINKKNRQRLNNKDFSLVSSNCNGALILHDLGIRFNSPFVNLWIRPKDFIRLCSNLKFYLASPVLFVTEEGIDYPVGLLRDIKIYFQHYHTQAEALEKWESRINRMNYDNVFFLFSDRDGCTYEDLLEFDRLDIKNKIVFTHKPYPEIESSFYIKGFETLDSIGNCFEIMPHHLGKKYYDQFDYVGWFNEGKRK